MIVLVVVVASGVPGWKGFQNSDVGSNSIDGSIATKEKSERPAIPTEPDG